MLLKLDEKLEGSFKSFNILQNSLFSSLSKTNDVVGSMYFPVISF